MMLAYYVVTRHTIHSCMAYNSHINAGEFCIWTAVGIEFFGHSMATAPIVTLTILVPSNWHFIYLRIMLCNELQQSDNCM